MKIAVVTAIFGGIDSPKPFCKQSVECDYFCFTEEHSPFPLPNLPDRLKAKYFKLQSHYILPGYDYYVWIDGNVQVTSPHFIKKLIDASPDGIAIQKHHERANIKEEIDFILDSENPYLTVRYANQPLFGEYMAYIEAGMPEDAPLYSCNIFGYSAQSFEVHSNVSLMNTWWNICLRWSWFDQSAFSYLAWYFDNSFTMFHGVEIVDFGPMFDNPYFKLHSHDNWAQ